MSEIVKNWTQWLKQSRFSYMSEEQVQQTLGWLLNVRDKVLERAELKEGDVFIDIGTGTGLLAFGAYELLQGNGKVIASDKFKDCVNECAKVAKDCGITQGFETLESGAEKMDLPDNSVNVVAMRSVLVHILDKPQSIKEFYRILRSGGRVSIFEPIIRSNTRYYELINPENITNYDKFKVVEAEFMNSESDPLTNFDQETLKKDFENAGFSDVDIELGTESSTYVVDKAMMDPWFNTPPSPGTPSMKQKFMAYFTEQEVDNYIEEVKNDLHGKTITVSSFSAYLKANKL